MIVACWARVKSAYYLIVSISLVRDFVSLFHEIRYREVLLHSDQRDLIELQVIIHENLFKIDTLIF